MLDGLARVAGTTEEEGVGTGRLAERKLVKSEALSSGLLDTGTGSAGEAEGGDRELGNLDETKVVGDGTDGDNGVLVGVGLVRLGDLTGNARDRKRGSVDLRLVQPPQDDLVEPRLSLASQESVELYERERVNGRTAEYKASGTYLDKKHEVGVLRLRGGTLTLLDVVLLNIDTLLSFGKGIWESRVVDRCVVGEEGTSNSQLLWSLCERDSYSCSSLLMARPVSLRNPSCREA